MAHNTFAQIRLVYQLWFPPPQLVWFGHSYRCSRCIRLDYYNILMGATLEKGLEASKGTKYCWKDYYHELSIIK